jgi:uncharacterized membrane protein
MGRHVHNLHHYRIGAVAHLPVQVQVAILRHVCLIQWVPIGWVEFRAPYGLCGEGVSRNVVRRAISACLYATLRDDIAYFSVNKEIEVSKVVGSR